MKESYGSPNKEGNSLRDIVGRGPYNLSELARETGYSRAHLSGIFNKRYNISPIVALVISNYSRGFLTPQKLLEEYGNLAKDGAALESLIARYKGIDLCRNPDVGND